VLLVPSMLQRWGILDLMPDESLVGSLVDAGRDVFDVFVLDWGELGDERLITWDEVVGRILRFMRRCRAASGAERIALVGYSQGGTLAAIAASLMPDALASLVTIAAPIDFAFGGALSPLTDRRLVDADLLADAGGVPPNAFRGLVAAMHPGATAVSMLSAHLHPDPKVRASFSALERWANDAVALPPEVLRVWLKRLVQDNALVSRGLSFAGRKVRLDAITAPTLVVVADGDTICPPESSLSLLQHIRSTCRESLRVSGGHVSGIAGPGSSERTHRPVAEWLRQWETPRSLRSPPLRPPWRSQGTSI
jgi:polyhydroxyalkanoate synthase subunit PhaC